LFPPLAPPSSGTLLSAVPESFQIYPFRPWRSLIDYRAAPVQILKREVTLRAVGLDFGATPVQILDREVMVTAVAVDLEAAGGIHARRGECPFHIGECPRAPADSISTPPESISPSSESILTPPPVSIVPRGVHFAVKTAQIVSHAVQKLDAPQSSERQEAARSRRRISRSFKTSRTQRVVALP
jgi:hypothetical protein